MSATRPLIKDTGFWCPQTGLFHDKGATCCASSGDKRHISDEEWDYDAIFGHSWTERWRIPVLRDSSRPEWRYHVAVSVPKPRGEGGLWNMVEPEEDEVAVLGSYLEFWLGWYNESWRKQMRERPFDIDSGTAIRVFFKTPRGWLMQQDTWRHGPYPFITSERQFPSITALLDDRETLKAKRWEQWKAEHSEVKWV